MRQFAIGDIHGCVKTLDALLTRLELTHEDQLIFLGDYIDRGPDSKGVIQCLQNLAKHYPTKCLLGNHEDFFLTVHQSDDRQLWKQWLQLGGYETLTSFKIAKCRQFPTDIIEFLESLPVLVETSSHVFVHGGLSSWRLDPVKHSTRDEMLWSRDAIHDRQVIGGRQLVVGHTPSSVETILQSLEAPTAFIDGGCVYSQSHHEFGFLAAYETTQKQLTIQPNLDFCEKVVVSSARHSV